MATTHKFPLQEEILTELADFFPQAGEEPLYTAAQCVVAHAADKLNFELVS